MPIASFAFDVLFAEALSFARRREVVLAERFYGELQGRARNAAFTVSDIEALDQIQAIRDSLTDAVARGVSFRDWQRQAAEDLHPLSGARRELVFRNAVQSAYGAGRTEQQREFAHLRPYLMWDAINDSRTRPAHATMDGFIAPIGDPIWQKWSPPAGHNCRCSRISLTERQARERGYPMQPRNAEPDPGWGYEKADDDRLEQLREQRVRGLPAPLATAAQERGATLAVMPAVLPVRTTWRDFPDVEIHASESAVKKHPAYEAAKAGDRQSAFDLVNALASDESVARLADLVRGDVLWLPVAAIEREGINRIPAALAELLAVRLGGATWDDVIQSNTVGHTGASGWHRMANPALFEGEVVAGKRYILVDDFVGQGGTLANLRGYVESKGGVVVGATVLTGQTRSAQLRLSPETLTAVRSKHGQVEPWWRLEFGYGFEALTESEARYLLRIEDAHTIRARVAEARS